MIGAAVVLALVAVGVQTLFEPSTWVLLRAVRELGPIGGWHCVQSATYVYDPSRERAESSLVADPPEWVVLDHAPNVEIDYVEVDLRGSDTVVWTHTGDERRVYVLSPGRVRSSDQTVCSFQLADWRIVGEHSL